MAHWFHRNPLKATTQIDFNLKGVLSTANTSKISNELRLARHKLLELVADPNHEPDVVSKAAKDYMSWLQGFITSFDPNTTGDSKMRHIIKFRWTNTLLGNTTSDVQDTVYEAASILFNVALWYTKHAAKLAGKDDPDMEEAKEIHKCLRTAAGLFTYIKDNMVGKLIEPPEKGTDLESRVLEAYIHQCTAEAQEITIARAIELKHSSSIVSALANETAKMFQDADAAMISLEEKSVAKWRKYLQFKMSIYYAYAYSYHGETLLAQDKCGEAIKCLQESTKNYEKAGLLGKDYTSTKGPGTNAKPQEHLFFRKLGPVVKRTLEKCVRENGFIYHQKVPLDVPELELKATYGLVAPEEFSAPDPNPLWTADNYNAFDITKAPPRESKDEKKDDKEKEIPPVKEADIPQSQKDPRTFSGCVVS